MEIKNTALAGTMESSDITVVIEPNPNNDVVINLKSSVEKQFGDQIKQVIKETLTSLNVKSAVVRADDRGALDCVIKARVQTAALRAAGEAHFDWEVED